MSANVCLCVSVCGGKQVNQSACTSFSESSDGGDRECSKRNDEESTFKKRGRKLDKLLEAALRLFLISWGQFYFMTVRPRSFTFYISPQLRKRKKSWG